MTKAPGRVIAAAGGVLALMLGTASAEAGKPNIMESCKICHTAADGVVRGKLVSVSGELKSLSVTVGPLVWIVKYGDDLKVKEGQSFGGPAALKTIPRDREIAVTFKGSEAAPVATQVAVKQPFKVPEAQLLPLEKMQALVAQGPEAGKYTLVDSRPGPMFAEGRIPGAVSLPYAAFKEKAASVLPADKAALVIFYCAGET
ncbi:MAG TPA: rhodanese-like domain-containing protein [bacterium]